MIVMIDNYDSFTYNLVQYLKILGARVSVFRNDAVSIPELVDLNPDGFVISPGPGRPEAAGISVELIRRFSGQTPILGVCLGHQAIAVAFGGSIVSARRLMHGKTSSITANGEGIFSGVASPFAAMRKKALRIQTTASTVVDTCGTGGDGTQSFNISTTTAFVVAGCGVTVAKHGNRSVSSRCGSADLLESLGVRLETEPEIVEEAITAIGIGFLFAPLYHSAMRHAAGPRKEIGLRSIFNMLGPLTNPGVGPEHALLKDLKRAVYVSITDQQALDAFQALCRLEGIIPALESSHALAYAMQAAPKLDKDNMILVNLSGRGDKDLDMVLPLLTKETPHESH